MVLFFSLASSLILILLTSLSMSSTEHQRQFQHWPLILVPGSSIPFCSNSSQQCNDRSAVVVESTAFPQRLAAEDEGRSSLFPSLLRSACCDSSSREGCASMTSSPLQIITHLICGIRILLQQSHNRSSHCVALFHCIPCREKSGGGRTSTLVSPNRLSTNRGT